MFCEENCPICFESLKNSNLCVTKCNHKYCVPCFIRHMQNPNANGNCPLCREDLMDDKLKDTLIEANIKNGDEDTSFDDVALLLSLNEVGANDDAITIIDEEIYGIIPKAKIAILVTAPPENILNIPSNPF